MTGQERLNEVRKKMADILKLHEVQIVNVGSHDEEEARRRRRVRYKTVDQALSMVLIEHPDQTPPDLDVHLKRDYTFDMTVETLHNAGWRRVIQK